MQLSRHAVQGVLIMHRRFIAAVTVFTTMFFSQHLWAQGCTGWQPGPLQLPKGDANGIIRALISWDPDGSNPPQQAVLVAGGSFTSIGGVNANFVAMWDGLQWRSLGDGMNNEVRALAVWNGDLIAGGTFTTANGVIVNGIARWDGQLWWPIGSPAGVSGGPAAVYALSTVFPN